MFAQATLSNAQRGMLIESAFITADLLNDYAPNSTDTEILMPNRERIGFVRVSVTAPAWRLGYCAEFREPHLHSIYLDRGGCLNIDTDGEAVRFKGRSDYALVKSEPIGSMPEAVYLDTASLNEARSLLWIARSLWVLTKTHVKEDSDNQYRLGRVAATFRVLANS